MAPISLERVDKVYPNGYVAARELSLTIADGELMVLVGPSGSGKSTVLRMIAGLETVTGGTIRIGDRDVTALPPQERDLAMVFQSYALYPHMSVAENLGFGLRVRKQPRELVDRRVREVAESLGLAALLDRTPKQLSGGQRQRVALGRAIIREPQAFLLDEPLSNLDAQLRIETRFELARLHRRLGATMVYVTHDQVEAMTLGDRIAVLRGGVLQQVAAPLDLYRRPANRFVAGFIGSPPMNFVSGAIETGRGDPRFVGRAIVVTLPAHALALSGRAVLGVRPQQLVIGAAPADGAGAEVAAVEPLGSEQIVHLVAGEERLAAVVPPDRPLRVGERVTVHVAPDAAHLFDAESGVRLSSD
jgi:multiple sugar transport system ATP-binding protein